MSATLKDVALASGVSVMSACAVLTGGGQNVKVSEAKAKLIRAKAEELQYEPNLSGRSLRTRRTDTIGVVFQHLTSFGEEPYYYQQLLDGIMLALFPRGYTLALSPMLVQSEGAVRVANGRFDGILWCCPDVVEASKNLRVPVVMVHAPQEIALDAPTFVADNERAMSRIVDHLVGLGHKRIGFVVKPHVAITIEAKVRIVAFLAAADRWGVTANVLLWEYEADQLGAYTSPVAPHTALVGYNDVHAGHILSRAKELGIRVPDDLSIVGFDSSSFCERTQPRLTSVHQPIEQIARDATECLLRLIDAGQGGRLEPRQDATLYDCQLDIRDSTAPPNPHRLTLRN